MGFLFFCFFFYNKSDFEIFMKMKAEQMDGEKPEKFGCTIPSTVRSERCLVGMINISADCLFGRLLWSIDLLS